MIRGMRIIMKIQIHSNISESECESESQSDTHSDSDCEKVDTLLEHLEDQLTSLDPILSKVEDHLKAFETRIHQPPINTFYPLKGPVEDWCNKKGLQMPFTLEQWFMAVLTDVVSTDLESRMLNFGETHVLWGKNKMSLFEILHSVPNYLTGTCPGDS
jgi:hypothetical protein